MGTSENGGLKFAEAPEWKSYKENGCVQSNQCNVFECGESGVRFRQSYALLSIVPLRPAAKPFAQRSMAIENGLGDPKILC